MRLSIICALVASLVFSGCGARRYVVHAEDYANALDHGGLVGAVTMRCRETAVRAHRTRSLDVDLDPIHRGEHDDYVVIQERASRSISVGVGIGGLLLGTLLGSMGGVLIYDAANAPRASHGDDLPEKGGKALGSALIIGGVASAVTGIVLMAQGAARGAEAPRRWQPSMTENTPCVVHQHDEAYERARRRSPARDHELKTFPAAPTP